MSEGEENDQTVAELQSDVEVLDLVKGLEAYAKMVEGIVNARFPEFPDTEVPELDDDNDVSGEILPIDGLHHFAREAKRNVIGIRQQMEQRLFGAKKT